MLSLLVTVSDFRRLGHAIGMPSSCTASGVSDCHLGEARCSAFMRVMVWRWGCSLQGFTYWIRQPGREASPAPSEERPPTPSQSQGGTPSVSPMDSPSVSARSSADEEVDFSSLSRCAVRQSNQGASWVP